MTHWIGLQALERRLLLSAEALPSAMAEMVRLGEAYTVDWQGQSGYVYVVSDNGNPWALN